MLLLYMLHNHRFGLFLDNGYSDQLVILGNYCLDLPVTNPPFLIDNAWLIYTDHIVDPSSLVLIATR